MDQWIYLILHYYSSAFSFQKRKLVSNITMLTECVCMYGCFTNFKFKPTNQLSWTMPHRLHVWNAFNHIYFLRDFRLPREVADICTLLGYYTAYSGNFLQKFRENLSVPSWRVKQSKQRAKKEIYWLLKMGPRGCPETPVRMYHYMLRNTPKQCRFHVHFLPNSIDNNNVSQRRTGVAAVATYPLNTTSRNYAIW